MKKCGKYEKNMVNLRTSGKYEENMEKYAEI